MELTLGRSFTIMVPLVPTPLLHNPPALQPEISNLRNLTSLLVFPLFSGLMFHAYTAMFQPLNNPAAPGGSNPADQVFNFTFGTTSANGDVWVRYSKNLYAELFSYAISYFRRSTASSISHPRSPPY